MPIVDGYTITEIIKQIDKNIVVIGITAMDNNHIIQKKSRECGMGYLIFKPYKQRQLFQILDEIEKN